MIVADEREITPLYSIIIAGAGFSVGPIEHNGVDSVKHFDDPSSSKDIGVVIMDMKMPSMDGIQASEIIKARNPDVKIIRISAYDLPKKNLFDAALVKPVSKVQLLETLERVLK